MKRLISILRTMTLAVIVLFAFFAWVGYSSKRSAGAVDLKAAVENSSQIDIKSDIKLPSIDVPNENSKDTQDDRRKLDLSRPLFTIDHAMVCPISLLYDRRADHGPVEIVEAFGELFNRSSKAQALGCEEWRAGIQVYAAPLGLGEGIDFVSIGSTPSGNHGLFTRPTELTNKGEPILPVAASH